MLRWFGEAKKSESAKGRIVMKKANPDTIKKRAKMCGDFR